MKKMFAVLALLFCTSLLVKAQSGGFVFNTGPAPCSVGVPACNVPVDGGGTIFFRYTAGYYGKTVNVWINAQGISDAFGPVPATLTETTTVGPCNVNNRFELDVPEAEVTDSAGNKYMFSGVQYLSQYYSSGGGGRGGGGAGCHYNDLGNGSFTLTPIQ
jgi:hypothetical protein